MKVDSIITIQKGELKKREWEKLLTRLTFRDADDMEVSAFQYVSGKDCVLMPRGAWDMIPAKVDVIDLRSYPQMPKIAYMRELDSPGYDGQAEAVRMMFKMQQGQVIAPPGRGKTEIALAFAAACRTRVLVIVHTADLYNQWLDRAAVAVPGMTLGRIQGKTCQVGHLTVAMAQTLKTHLDRGGKFWRQFGAIIVDEAHHAAAQTWEWLLNVCPAFYRFGITASQKRSDGREGLVRFNIGPVIYKLKFKSGVPLSVQPIQTGFKSRYNGMQWTNLVRELVNDGERNAKIAAIASEEVVNGNTVLVLSRQIKHLEHIWAHMQTQGDADMSGVKIVTGKLKQREQFIQALRDRDITCILGTQLFEEGVDIPRLNRIVLAFPGTEITALQKVGRGARSFEGKTETIVYDLMDDLVTALAKQYLRRRTWYKSVGIHIEKVRPHVKVRTDEKRRTETPKGRLGNRLYQVARPGR